MESGAPISTSMATAADPFATVLGSAHGGGRKSGTPDFTVGEWERQERWRALHAHVTEFAPGFVRPSPEDEYVLLGVNVGPDSRPFLLGSGTSSADLEAILRDGDRDGYQTQYLVSLTAPVEACAWPLRKRYLLHRLDELQCLLIDPDFEQRAVPLQAIELQAVPEQERSL